MNNVNAHTERGPINVNYAWAEPTMNIVLCN